MGEEKPSYFGIIPATVRYDKSLKANAKLLYSELTCLSEKDGYCYASNNYFAKLYEVDPSSISKWLKQLADKGYIKIEYKYNGKECTERKIFINTNAKGSAKNQEGIDICQEVLPNCQKGIDIRQEGYCQIAKENNTRVNNTSINNINTNTKELSTKKRNSKTILFDRVDDYTDSNELRDILKQYLQFKLKNCKGFTLEQWNIQLDLLNKFSNGNLSRAIEKVKFAFASNYQSLVYPNELNKNNQQQNTKNKNYNFSGLNKSEGLQED